VSATVPHILESVRESEKGSPTREIIMVNKILTALVLGLAVTSFVSPSSAQDMAKRDAAVAKCTAQAQKKVPNQETADQVANRSAAYAECMRAEGFAP
jgi:hypothetical protein